MLNAATAMIDRSGLTVSLEHISFEDVIQQAGVSRSAVYRRWPYKDLFFSDLLKELARATRPAAVSSFEEATASIRHFALAHLGWLETPEHRHDLVLELIRARSPERLRDDGRVHRMAHVSGPTCDLPQRRRRASCGATCRRALAESERGFIDRIASSWEQLAGLLGYRLRPELHASFEIVASLASATLRGLVVMALSTPDIGSQRIRPGPSVPPRPPNGPSRASRRPASPSPSSRPTPRSTGTMPGWQMPAARWVHSAGSASSRDTDPSPGGHGPSSSTVSRLPWRRPSSGV